ncbi:MAG TPA: 50S ribosomal protein L25 [Candidatus Magasanikbacteria bacterium]|nr:50S ribosomal protein L25 [Candidatus Magasanikbacteria bacterium]
MTYSLTLKNRPAKKLAELRLEGLLPGVIYGPHREPMPVSVSSIEFNKLYTTAGESSLIDVMVEGAKESVKALIQDVQYDPVKGSMIHFDLREINMNEEMHATVQLVFVGEAPAVKELGGTLMKPHGEVEVKCLPKDLVSQLEVDLTVLKSFEEAIFVGDLKLPAGLTIVDSKEQLVAKVTPPLSEDELKAMEAAPGAGPALEEIEVEKKGKKEEEGEAAEAAEKK